MKKVIFIFLAVVAFGCGDGSNRSSETGADTRTEDNYSEDALEADTTDMNNDMDTTASPGMDTESGVDTTSNP